MKKWLPHLSLLIMEPFVNSYWLCRFLSRYFEIFDCGNVINNLITNRYVSYIEKGGVKDFELTASGNEFMNSNKVKTIEMLLREFPKQEDILKAMAGE